MSTTLKLPEELDDSTIENWLKGEGQPVAAGEPVCTLDHQGQSRTIDAPSAGILARQILPTGTRCGGGAPLGILAAPGEDVGWAPNAISCVRVMLLRRCEECGRDYPVNGLVNRERCRACGDVCSAPLDYWKSYVFENVTEVLASGKPEGSNVLGGAHGPGTVVCAPVLPLCRKCSTLLDWNAFLQVWNAAQQAPQAALACQACGEEHRLRMTPEWARPLHPKLTAVLGETAVEPGDGRPTTKPVLFNCPGCAAPLPIDGTKRIVRCRFCDADCYLPDDLWLHFNPAEKRGRWWLLFSP